MSTNKKINDRLENITSTVKNYVTRFTDLCESEIEKLFLIDLLYYLFESSFRLKTGFEDSRVGDNRTFHNIFFKDITPIYEDVDEYSPAIKLVGIKFSDEIKMSKSNKVGVLYRNEYLIYPQYSVEMDNSNYRIDFAIICRLHEQGLLKSEVKIAIECDGFEFHSSKQDLKRDTSRNRIFTRHGWKPYRYSGSEIYNLTTHMDIDGLFYEIRTLADGII